MRLARSAPILALLLAAIGGAGATENAAPFLVVSSPGARVGSIPLESTLIDARVTATFADVTLVQRYSNLSAVPLELVYVVPAAPGIAMHRFEVRVGDRVLRARIERKREAREQFVQARKQGKKASLLEQYGDEAFRMSIANVEPGQAVQVELRYSQLLEPVAGRYALGFAPPVAARFSDERATRGPATGRFEVGVAIDGGLPLIGLTASDPAAEISQPAPNAARVRYAVSAPPTRGLTLGYGLRGAAAADGLLVGSEGDERFFLLQVQPPATLEARAVLPREYLFVVDRTSVRFGYTREAYRYLMAQLLGALRPVDRFNVVVFDDAAAAFMPTAQHAGPEAIARSIAWLEELKHKGWERKGLDAALDLALATPRTPGTARTVVLVSDGQFSLGGARLDAFRARFADANLVPFGAGWGVDIDRLAALGRLDGNDAVILTDPARADEEVRRFRAQYAAPLVTNLRVTAEGATLEGVTPVGDLFAERPTIVLGRFSGEGRLVIRGESVDGPWQREYPLAAPAADADAATGAALARSWARRRIGGLLDYLKAEERSTWVEEATQLGLRYSVATPYTSFIAVEEKEVEAPKPAPATLPQDQNTLLGDLLQELPSGAGFMTDELRLGAVAPRDRDARIATRADRPARGGPLVVAILDHGRLDDPFYAGAARYYASAGALVVRDLDSLAALADALRRIAGELGAPLGEVRIVVHGSQWNGLATRLTAGGADADGEGLAAALLARPFGALDERVLDAASRLRIEGCGLGRRPDLLEALALVLGGDDAERPVVTSVDAFIEFTLVGTPQRRERAYRAEIVAGRSPPAPGRHDLAYPIRIAVSAGDPVELQRAGTRRWLGAQDALRARLARLGLAVSDLAWRIEGGAVIGEGRALIRFTD